MKKVFTVWAILRHNILVIACKVLGVEVALGDIAKLVVSIDTANRWHSAEVVFFSSEEENNQFLCDNMHLREYGLRVGSRNLKGWERKMLLTL